MKERFLRKWSLLVIITAFVVLLASMAPAQTWHYTNQVTVAWDAVTTTTDGSTIPAGQIAYNVYVCDTNAPDKTGAIKTATNVDVTQHTITFDQEGKYFIGVSAVRTNGDLVQESEVAWSDNPLYVMNGEVFGFVFFKPPAAPGGLRPAGN